MRLFTRGLVVTLAVTAGVFFGGNSGAVDLGGRELPSTLQRVRLITLKLSEFELIQRQLNRMEATLDRVETNNQSLNTHIQWLETVANQTRIDRAADLKRDQCFDSCGHNYDLDKNSPEYKVQWDCNEACGKMAKSPGGGC